MDGGLYLSDGGIETVLIFREGFELPLFAAFVLLDDEAGRNALRRYYRPFMDVAAEADVGFVLESPTWRASPRWGEEHLSEEAAEAYHRRQIGVFAETEADVVSAFTMTYVEEAMGVARAAAEARIPSVISFTVEKDGRLPSGQPLGEAIEQVDAEASRPAYFMVNCAHPDHLAPALSRGGDWTRRIHGVRANASTQSSSNCPGSTRVTRSRWEWPTASCGAFCLPSTSSVAVAVLTNATWRRLVTHGLRPAEAAPRRAALTSARWSYQTVRSASNDRSRSSRVTRLAPDCIAVA